MFILLLFLLLQTAHHATLYHNDMGGSHCLLFTREKVVVLSTLVFHDYFFPLYFLLFTVPCPSIFLTSHCLRVTMMMGYGDGSGRMNGWTEGDRGSLYC
jgi:hypothetical protein